MTGDPPSGLHIDPAQLARFGSLPIMARVIVEGALSDLHRYFLQHAFDAGANLQCLELFTTQVGEGP